MNRSTKSRPSMREVAHAAGVSLGTVSHVLNHPEKVAPATKQRVHDAINKLGFVRSEVARRLRAGTSALVGVIVYDVSIPGYAQAVRGIEETLREYRVQPMICSSDAEPERERELLRMFAAMNVRAVIVTPSPATGRILQELEDRIPPTLLLDPAAVSTTHSSVFCDDAAGIRASTEHLIGLGHRRFGFLNGPSRVHQAINRRVGADLALTAAGLDPAKHLLEIPHKDGLAPFTAEAGAHGTARLLDSGWNPTAIICASDRIAMGAMREIRRRGLSIPGDISVTGHDDIDVASELMTPLTTAHRPMVDTGRAAARLVMEQGNETENHPSIRSAVFTPELVVRASTAPPNPQHA